MDGRLSNFTLKDQIAEYWGARSATFDDSPGHGIRTVAEVEAWATLFRTHLPGGARDVLELASGTGEVTRVLRAMNLRVTGLDLAEPMIARARMKHADAGATLRFLHGDAENTMLPPASFDAVLCRHLVWTLPEPARAMRDWLRVLRPGGRVVIVDGDWVRLGLAARLRKRLLALWDRLDGTQRLWDEAAHEAIMRQLPFRDGLRDADVVRLLGEAGFGDIRRGGLDGPYRAQRRSATAKERLSLDVWRGHWFIVSAARPAA
jgi:ubiquinone/menaquinone biosynthesis C-methylase UbiE